MTTQSCKAVIDLGTNSFHLLVVQAFEEGGYKILHRERAFVKLALDGIDHISHQQFEKGLLTLKRFGNILKRFKPDETCAFGTAALREAINGRDFIEAAKQELGQKVYCIDGDTEATLTYYGVRNAIQMDTHPVLIIDIGGGSVELIIANNTQRFWQVSLPLGASLLKDRFHQHDPIAPYEQEALRTFLEEKLKPLHSNILIHKPVKLIGVAGSFETVADIISANNADFHYEHGQVAHQLPLGKFRELHHQFLQSTHQERLAMKGMQPERADMIVVAIILIDYIIRTFGFQRLELSKFGLKEGILHSLIHQIPIATAEL